MSAGGRWTAVITVKVRESAVAGWLERALAPEAAREVPRVAARVARRAPTRIEISLRAGGAGPLRAALNTYLGWIGLSLATARVAAAATQAPP